MFFSIPCELGVGTGKPFRVLTFLHFRFCILTQCLLPKNTCLLLFVFPFPPSLQPQRLRLAWPLPSWVSLAQSCHSPKTAMALGCFPKTSLKFKLLLSGGRVALFMMQFQSRIKVRRRHRLWSLVSVIIDLAHSHPPLWLHYGHLTGRGPFTKTAKLSIYCLYLWARHCLRHCGWYEETGWLMDRNLGRKQH